MPEATWQISVSRREAYRPRLLQASVSGRETLVLRLSVDANGSFEADLQRRERELAVSAGLAYFQWYAWPPDAPARDFTSQVTAAWNEAGVSVYLQDLYE